MIDNGYWENGGFSEGIRIVSAGHIFAKHGRKIERPFGRSDWLLLYIATGSESFFINGEKKTAQPGSFIIFKPGEAQTHICEHEGVSEFYYVHFEFENSEAQKLIPFRSSEIYSTNSAGAFSEAFQHIITELQQGRLCYKEICVALFKTLIFSIKRKLDEDSEKSGSESAKLVRKAVHMINLTWNKTENLEYYAEQSRISKFHLSRLFKAETGLTVIAYRNRIRLRHAEEMLTDSTASISEIAQECGYESPQYFCDAFKKVYGVSPSEYRKKF